MESLYPRKNKTVWEATLNIATTTNGEKILYDIDPIKMVEEAIKSAPTATNNNIHQNKPKSQEKNSDRDTLGNTLSEEQMEFFKDSKVRDENGNLIVMYHGTNNDFTVFDSSKNEGLTYSAHSVGNWFTSNHKIAQSYRIEGKVLETYLNLTNPLTINAKGKWYYQLNYHGHKGSDAIAKMAQRRGYDGVIFKDVIDNPNIYGSLGTSTVVVTFDSNQSKLTTNTNPTSNTDIRYSDREHYWHTGMSNKEVSMIERMAAREVSTTDKYIDNENKWLYNRTGDNTYFALYSTAHEDNPTITYACKGTQAIYEHQFLIEILEEVNNYGSVESRTKVIDEILGNYGDDDGNDNAHSRNTLGERIDNENATVYSQTSGNRPSEALLDCLQNIWKIQERNRIEQYSNERVAYSDRDNVSVYDLIGENDKLIKEKTAIGRHFVGKCSLNFLFI